MMYPEKPNLLLVDDRPENLLALEAILDDLEFNIVTADSGKEALRCLLKQDFALILLDVEMPGLDGFETAELIRSRRKTRFTPIIFLTAINKTEQHVFRGYAVGAVDYLFKPYAPEVLRSKVRVFADLYMKTPRGHETSRAPAGFKPPVGRNEPTNCRTQPGDQPEARGASV